MMGQKGMAQQLAASRVQNKNKYQTAVLKQQISRPPFSHDRRGGNSAKVFAIPHNV